MQASFAFAATDLDTWRARLGSVGSLGRRRPPIGQLIKSIISARTRDAVSTAAYDRLVGHYGCPAALARATPTAVATVIADVTYADGKAEHLVAALGMVGASAGGFALPQLATLPLPDALAWLERLPGVARKVSASTLNASTLARPVMIVDTHVLRVLARTGFVRTNADYREGSEAVTAAAPHWSGDDYLAFHIALKRLGQEVCRWDMPRCEACPLEDVCATARRGSGDGR